MDTDPIGFRLDVDYALDPDEHPVDFTLDSVTRVGNELHIGLSWLGDGGVLELRRDLFAAIGLFAEDRNFIEILGAPTSDLFRVTIGDQDSKHGHILVLKVGRKALPEVTMKK